MNNTEEIVNDALNSLDGVQRAEANPYLYTRIEQRLRNRPVPAPYQQRFMPVVAIALLLFISLNIFSYFKKTDEAYGSKSSGDGIENFANEYNLSEQEGL